jgi:anaerobic selenocysteine-containing dehydrogenase
MDRRSFIKLTAISGTSATLAACSVPQDQLIRFVPEEELVPGVAEWKPSVCPQCGGGCGVSVRVMQADVETVRNGQAGVVRAGVAKKLEGNAAHPVNQGGLCARGQAAIQLTYHPDRITQPLKRKGARGEGAFDLITWDQAIGELVAKLDQLSAAGDQKSLAAVIGGRRSYRRTLTEQFLTKFGAPAAVVVDPFGDAVLRRANDLSFGQAQLPTFDLRNSRFVLSFGADFLGTWNSVVSQSQGYGHMRRGRPGVRGEFVQVESRMTTTGASADHWIPVKPGTEGVLALGLAHVLLEHDLRPATSGRASSLIDGWSGGLAEYSPENVERLTGVGHERLERLAHEMIEQLPAVAIVGGAALAHTNGLFTALAVNALNELLGAVGQPGGVHFMPQINQAGAGQSIEAFAAAVNGGSQTAKVLLLDGANPVYLSPKPWRVKDALAKAELIVSFGSFVDDTSAMADLILPDHTFLESWTDATPESGALTAVASVAAPAMKPLYTTRSTPDVLLEVGQKLSRPLDFTATTFDAALKEHFDVLGEDAFTTAQTQGGWWGALPVRPAAGGRAAAAPARGAADARPAPVKYEAATFNGDASQYPYLFLPYQSIQFGDGASAHLPWLQELPDPTTSVMWGSWMELNPKTAAMLGIKTGDVVEVASSTGSLQTRAFVNPAIAPELIAMPMGQGHEHYTRYASGRGENPISLLAAVTEPATGALAWAATRVKVTRIGEGENRMAMFSVRGELREKPHEGEKR